MGTTHWSNSSWSWNAAKYISLFSLKREELPQYWKDCVILLICMKSDKTNYEILRHITVINFKHNFSQHSSCKANYACKQNWSRSPTVAHFHQIYCTCHTWEKLWGHNVPVCSSLETSKTLLWLGGRMLENLAVQCFLMCIFHKMPFISQSYIFLFK